MIIEIEGHVVEVSSLKLSVLTTDPSHLMRTGNALLKHVHGMTGIEVVGQHYRKQGGCSLHELSVELHDHSPTATVGRKDG